MNQPTLITLACGHCAAPLEIGPTVDHFECMYCGMMQLVARTGEKIQTKLIENNVDSGITAAKKEAAKLAIERLEQELSEKYAEQMRLQSLVEQEKSPPEIGVQSFESHVRLVIVAVAALGIMLVSQSKESTFAIIFLGLLAVIGSIVLYLTQNSSHDVTIERLSQEPSQTEKELIEIENAIDLLERKIETNRKIVNG